MNYLTKIVGIGITALALGGAEGKTPLQTELLKKSFYPQLFESF